MGVVVGFVSTVEISGGGGDRVCAINASWDGQPNSERFYCLDGEFSPVKTINKPTESVNVTVYSPGPKADVSPSTQCDSHADICDIQVNGNVMSCEQGGGGESMPTGPFMVTSYSYSKDDGIMPGEESWSLNRHSDNIPNFVIRGISDGSGTDNSGIEFVEDGDNPIFYSYTGNVSADSVGRADTLKIGQVSQVGGGSDAQGATGQGSVSINYTPLWI